MNKKNLIVIGMAIIGLGVGTIIGLQQIKNTKITTASQQDQKQVFKSKIEELQQEQQRQTDEIWEKERQAGCSVVSIPNCEEMPQILAVLKGKETLVNANWREENQGFSTMEYTSKKNYVFTFFIPASRANDTEAIDRIKQTLDEGGKYEADSNMTYFEDTCRYGDQMRARQEILAVNETCRNLDEERQRLHDDFSKQISDYRRQLDLLNARPEADQQKAMEAIRQFREKPGLELVYVKTYPQPTKFGIGKIVSQGENSTQTEIPEGYSVPVEIYQEKEPIGGGCEVYEYEVDVETNKIVEMRIVYPAGYDQYELGQEEQVKCDKTDEFLYQPLYTEAQLEEIAMNFLKKNVANFDEIKDEFVYRPSTAKSGNTIANERFWRWTGEKPEVPEGWMVDTPPVINLLLASSGEIIQYGDNTDSFRVVEKIKNDTK
jgi:hypothetical protein